MIKQRRIGLARMMSKRGYCSRAQAFALIRAGRVKLNGVVQRDSERPVREADHIEVDGQTLMAADKIYLMMNKPRGLVTTALDEKGRATVYSLLDPGLPWVAPVGRLDKASEGMLLLTNDSEWAARITSPGSQIEKTYHVQVGTVVDESLLKKICAGVSAEGQTLGLKRVTRLRGGQKNTWLETVLDEGRNRQIRRIFDGLQIEVVRLIRVAIGGLQLGNLAKGQMRELTSEEIAMLTAPSSSRV